ncbi:DUF1189 domain-containing protein [Bacillus sp. CMF12]|uniref:DUF1189 domain-containing protein n=1 Tax=Bacillaceae TaxID=186817 RepID=UPI001FB1D761|nr:MULTISPECIES: DUF1189 domain-containing protein [Bacillaceae]UOE54420.1 DUF1189 domain-containing protein [Cytobacillus oceanisediminis]USK48931.1 DUF1189 domain-containing protein [Bacillus sp. CMF12]
MNIFLQFYKSLFSPKDIALFRHQGIGKTILYVFFLTLLSVLPTVYYSGSAIINGLNAIDKTIDSDLPGFEITEGQLHTEEEAPVTLNKDNFTIIVDSTGAVDTTVLSESGNTIALLKNEVYIHAEGQKQTYPYTLLTSRTITKDDLSDFLSSAESLMPIIIPLIAVVIYIFAAGIRFIEISLIALAGLLLKNALSKKLEYRHLWRISAYSITLPTIFFAVMSALQTVVQNGAIINWFVSLIILLLSIKEVPSHSSK